MSRQATLAGLQAQLECVKREVARRERAYPRLVDDGTLTPHEATYELHLMRGVAGTLRGMIEDAQLPLFAPGDRAQSCPDR